MANMEETAYTTLQGLITAVPPDSTVAFTTFNNIVEVGDHVAASTFNAQSIRKRSSGSTSLYDAIVLIINAERTRSSDDDVSFLILTDGADTSSTRTVDDARVAVSMARELGWTIRYIGTNQDALDTADRMGMDRNLALNYGANNDDLRGAMAAVHRSMSSETRGDRANIGFTIPERQASMRSASEPPVHRQIPGALLPTRQRSMMSPVATDPSQRWVSIDPRSGDLVLYNDAIQDTLTRCYTEMVNAGQPTRSVNVVFGRVLLRATNDHSQITDGGGERDVRLLPVVHGVVSIPVSRVNDWWHVSATGTPRSISVV